MLRKLTLWHEEKFYELGIYNLDSEDSEDLRIDCQYLKVCHAEDRVDLFYITPESRSKH
jgi:hypothetical protein